jgi:hypothetical protein
MDPESPEFQVRENSTMHGRWQCLPNRLRIRLSE